MEFIKKHYEKVILSVVLLGLAVASAFLIFKVSEVRQFLDDNDKKITNTKPKPLKPINLTSNEATLNRLATGAEVKLARDHNVFNPVTWQRKSDGNLIKIVSGGEVGPGAVTITKITPLNLIITYDGTNGVGDSLRYQFAVTREADKNPSKRRKGNYFATSGSQNEIFVLKDVRGPKENPSEFLIEIKDDKRQIVLKQDKSYTQVMGYMADLAYDPENKKFASKRVDDQISFGGDKYNIVAINEREVVLSSISTTKRTTIKSNAAP